VRPSSSARIAPDSSRSHPSSEASALRVRLGIRNNPARSSDEPSANTTRARLLSPASSRATVRAVVDATSPELCGALERRRFVPRPCAQQHDAGLGRRPRSEDAEAACHRRHRVGRDYPHADARIAAKLLTPRSVAARAAGSRHGRRVRARPRSPREQGRPRRTPQPGAASSPRPAEQQAPPDHHRRSRSRTESRPPTASGPSISTCPQSGGAPEQARLATAPAVSQAECRTPLQTTAGASGQRSTLET
jgi:hypothetical protein